MKKHIFIKFLICMLLVLTMFSMSAFTYNNTTTFVADIDQVTEDNTDPNESTETTTVDLSSLDQIKDYILNYSNAYGMYKTDGTEDIYLVKVPAQAAAELVSYSPKYDSDNFYYSDLSKFTIPDNYLLFETTNRVVSGSTIPTYDAIGVQIPFYFLASESMTTFQIYRAATKENYNFSVVLNCTSELIYDHTAVEPDPSQSTEPGEDPTPSQSTEPTPGESPEPSEEPGKSEEKSIIDKIAKWISDCIEQLKAFLKGLFNEKITLKATKSNALSVSPVMLSSSSMVKQLCTACLGKGTITTTCGPCEGTGTVKSGKYDVECDSCGGDGKRTSNCTTCSGNGYIYVSSSGETVDPGNSSNRGIITIYDYPTDRSVTPGAKVTLTANATATNGAEITYQWYVKSYLSDVFETDEGLKKQTVEFMNGSGGVSADTQFKFYVVCSANGCESKTSPVMTLTILKDAANPSTSPSPSPSEGTEQASITAEITGTTKIKEGEYIDVTCEATASNGNECTYDWYAYVYGMYRRIGVTEARLYMLEDVVEPIKLRCLVNADGCSTKYVDFEIEVEASPRYNVTYKVMRKNSLGILTEVELGKAVIRAGDTIPTNLDFIGSNFDYLSLDKNGEEKIAKDMKPTDDITVYVNYKAATGIDSLIDKASAMLGTVGGVCVLALGVVIFNKARKGVVNMQADSARATEARARRQAARDELKAARKERKQERKKKRTAKKIERNWKKTNKPVKPKKSKNKKHKK